MVTSTSKSVAVMILASASLSTTLALRAPENYGGLKGYTRPTVPKFDYTPVHSGYGEKLTGYAENAPACTCDSYGEITVKDVDTVKEAVKYRIMADIDSTLEGTRRSRAIGAHIGAIVRLLFHESAPFDKTSANALLTRVNGCVDTTHITDHKGLDEIIDFLEVIFLDHSVTPEYMSRADMWQIAGIGALELGRELALEEDSVVQELMQTKGYEWPEMNLPWLYGRPDVAGAPRDCGRVETVGFMPEATWGLDSMQNFLIDTHGFTWEDVVALLGCHTLGNMQPDNSGFIGGWVDNISWFDNQYFMDLVGRPWQKARVGFAGQTALNGNFQWGFRDAVTGQRAAMLNVDMCLAYPDVVEDFDTGCTTSDKSAIGQTICERGTNEPSVWAETFAYGTSRSEVYGNKMEGMEMYMKSFPKAFYKMCNLGFDTETELKPVCDSYKPCKPDIKKLIQHAKDDAAQRTYDLKKRVHNSINYSKRNFPKPSYSKYHGYNKGGKLRD